MISWYNTAALSRSLSPAAGRETRTTAARPDTKNWSVVRRVAGNFRYCAPEQLDLLTRIYVDVHYHANFVPPVVKLATNSRVGSGVARSNDEPQTPFARVLASPNDAAEHKDPLRETCALLNLFDLHQEIIDLQRALFGSLPSL